MLQEPVDQPDCIVEFAIKYVSTKHIGGHRLAYSTLCFI